MTDAKLEFTKLLDDVMKKARRKVNCLEYFHFCIIKQADFNQIHNLVA